VHPRLNPIEPKAADPEFVPLVERLKAYAGATQSRQGIGTWWSSPAHDPSGLRVSLGLTIPGGSRQKHPSTRPDQAHPAAFPVQVCWGSLAQADPLSAGTLRGGASLYGSGHSPGMPPPRLGVPSLVRAPPQGDATQVVPPPAQAMMIACLIGTSRPWQVQPIWRSRCPRTR